MMFFSRRVWLRARGGKSAWASSSLGPPLSSRSDSTDEPRTVSTSHAGKEGCESPEADGWGASAKGAQPRVAALARFRSHSNFGLVGLVGVQSNQYPRALDIARPFRDAGIQVVMGGFHVSGCLSMLDGHAVDLDTGRDMGIAMFAGEAEDRLDTVLRDAADGRLAPLYDFMRDLPGIEGTPVPFLPKRYVARTLGLSASF